MSRTGKGIRVGITGVPGVGKSTFIDQFGTNLIDAGHRVAVLAIDPSSQRTGGSILGDKTRMERLSVNADAFIRPSPAGATLGGVTRTTREVLLLCEAAGYDVVLVETVGVGQSETIVSEMVDFFLVLMLAGAGDELQGIKKGILELADAVVVTKADRDNEVRARLAASEYRHALHLIEPVSPTWSPPVLTCSAVENDGLDEVWTQICLHQQRWTESGELGALRSRQQLRWMWSMIEERLIEDFQASPRVVGVVERISDQVANGLLHAPIAAEQLLSVYEID
jgi:LAO/AO transport system kinase